MSFIGEAAVTGLLDRVMGTLLDSAVNFVADHKQIHKQLKHWQSVLPGIQAVLNDAEEKQIKNEAVKNWLDDLQDLAYDVEDILDEFDYEALRLRLRNIRAQANTSRVRKLKLIPTCCTGSSFTPSSFQFNNSMIPKIKEVTTRLEGLTTRRSSLGLSEIMSQAANSKEKNPRPLQPTSLVDEAVDYVGRHNEKREMLDFLKCSNNSDGVSVLSIVGMGGMGKTTLAQLVYNDSSIAELFDHKAWVCVSDNFDAVNITKTILQSITSEPCSYSDLNLLQVKLKEKLSGKTCLLVLDDIWNESYDDWRILRSPFGAGTKIIVTTRLQKVSSNVEPGKAFYLDKLSHDDCLSIFTQHALKARNFDGHPQLKEVGEKMVRRCGGLPLAAKAIGSLLRSAKDHDEWERTCESEIWDLPEDQCGIVPALRLSYHHLPSHLKRCFAYCSIFPKDYEFEEEAIILLWRAEGFLQQNAKRSIKDVGKQYFGDLVSRSFFQMSSEDKSRFVMHDLINDLAQLVARDICSKSEGDKQRMFLNRIRHSSYLASRYDIMKKFEPFNQANSLRTFLPLIMQQPNYPHGYLTNFVLVDLLPRLGCLRVLSLCGYEIIELPDDVFENLKHLRYLNFSHTKIKWLPDSLCTLYHLETLLLRGCRRLQKLPSKMENLVNLHYLDIRDANSLKRMPFGIGKLRNLERLSDFVIGEGDGDHIGELKNLSDLRGDFCLSGLENVNGEDAGEAKLNEKLGINWLELKWSSDFRKATRKKEVEERVLDSLRPPKKVELLVIKNYFGARLSSWIADSSFNKLSSMKLLNCKNCKSLPSIGRLPLLKYLSIIGLDEVDNIAVELFGENQSNSFASLESLSFKSLPNWVEWDPCEGDEQASKFPSLRELSVIDCPQLLGRLPTRLPSLQKLEIKKCRRLVVSISSFPWLRELSVKECGELVDECSSSSTGEVTSLQRVILSDISKFSIPAERMMSRFANSEHFSIDGWKELESLSKYGFGLVGHHFIRINDCPQLLSMETEEERLHVDKVLPGVESLLISKCERLNRLPKLLHAFTFLTVMKLVDCPGFVSFAESIFPPGLKKLEIWRCINLQYLVGEKENNNRSMSSNTPLLLEHLVIRSCESLICLSSRDDICNQLRYLEIVRCSKLGNLFLNSKLPIKLKHLHISNCQMLESIAQDFHETTDLKYINICDAPNIKSFPRGLEKLSHLQHIVIDNCSSLVSLEESGLPWTTTNLRVFSIRNCSNIGALPKCINNFISLQILTVSNCWAEISFPEEGFPTNLISLAILNAPKIYSSLVAWGFSRLASLQQLFITGEGCSNVVSFPEQGIGMTLPPSLTEISIWNFENLEFMCSKGFQQLTSLQILSIYFCPKLTSLPEKGMLLSLGELRITDCPLIEEGREWSKIAHIPLVRVNGKTVIPTNLD